MTFSCDPCDCLRNYYQGKDTFMQAVLTLLCNIRSALLGSSESFAAAIFPAVTEVAAADIGAAFAAAVDLPDNTVSVILDNQTNGDVWVSMNGGTSEYAHLKAGDKESYPLGSLKRVTTAVVSLKDGENGGPSSGLFFVRSIG